jgi:hypothetical protein
MSALDTHDPRSLRDELEDLLRFEASSSVVMQQAMIEAEEGACTTTDPWELFALLFQLHKGIKEALFALADRVERDERLLGMADD